MHNNTYFYIAQSAQLSENNTKYNYVVTTFSAEYKDIALQMGLSLEAQKNEVSTHLLNIGRFYDVLVSNQEKRDSDLARLTDKKKEVISYREQLARARNMNSIKNVILEKLEANIDEGKDKFEEMKVCLKKSYETTEVC